MSFWWPDIENADEAKKACAQAAGVAFFVAAVTSVVAWLQMSGKINLFPGINQTAFIDAGLFVIIGIGLIRHSRIAAILGLMLYVIERIFMVKTYGMNAGQIVSGVLFSLVFITGVRGSFTWHRLLAAEKSQDITNLEVKNTKPLFRKILSGLTAGVFLAILAAGAYWIWPHVNPEGKGKTFQRKTSYQLPNIKFIKEMVKRPVEESTSQIPISGGRTFRLKSGETVKGRVIQDDEVFYMLETFGGKQTILIKEDIASEE